MFERNDLSDRRSASSWSANDAPVALTQLRLATGLVAAIPGADLSARCSTGVDLVVSRHPAADVTPATLRSITIETWRRRRWDAGASTVPSLRDLRLGGSADHLGGGVFRVVGADHAEQRWLATLVRPDDLAELLATIGTGGAHATGLSARVVPDRDLGVAMIEITSDADVPAGVLDRAAADAAARCYVAELIGTV